MNLHEHQAKELLREFGVAVPRGRVAYTADEAGVAAADLGFPVVVKAQIHAGGRGKAGGVRFAPSEAEVRDAAETLLGSTLVTKQTGPEGRLVRRLLIEEGVEIARELYIELRDRPLAPPPDPDRERRRRDGHRGGRRRVPREDPLHDRGSAMGLQPFQARRVAFGLGLSGEAHRSGALFLTALWRAFDALDASQVEINPMLVTGDERVLALDAKVSVDDSALFRQPRVAALATSTRNRRSRSRRAATGSATSGSTAPWAAW